MLFALYYETGTDNLHSDVEEHHICDENISIVSAESEMDSIEQTLISSEMNAKAQGDSKRGACDANHPSMIKYQKDLKERLLCLHRETDEQLIDLKRAISAQDKENDHFAKQGHELQKELCLQEEKLNKIHQKYDEEIIKKHCLEEKCKVMRQNFEKVDEKLQRQRKNDIDYQRTLEDIAFEVVQLTFLQNETFTDAKNLRRTVEKSTKDRENLELQKLRQDLLIFRLENDKFNLEDKINLYKVQRAIKREEVSDLRKELNAAHNEMEIISYEKQQIVHQWKQSLVSLEKQDRVLSEIRNSVRSFEDGMQTLQMEIASHKKSVRKELERNEMLTVTLQYRESDIARCERELKDAAEKQNSLLEEMDVIKKITEVTENELIFLNDGRNVKEKELEAKEREIQKCCSVQKSMEKKYMDVLHKKITITKASKYTEKLIKDIRKSIELNEEKGSKKERERTKLLLELGNLKTYLNTLEENLDELQKESNQRGDLLDRSEANALKIRDKIDIKRNECKNLENELQELIARAGGQELAPFERELANLRKEINIAEQGKRDLEQEYLRHQHELFSLNRQSSVKSEENDMYKKRLAIMEGKKFQLEADIAKEEKDIKDTQNRIICIEKEIANVNRLLNERKELKECLKQAAEITKSDFKQTLKEAELNYLQKQAELNLIQKKKRKTFSKMMEMQKYIVFWEQKVRLADETRRILKSEAHISELFNIRSEIRRLQLKQNQIKKEQENISKEMTKAAYRHTDLYVEADKQALLGKRRKTPEYAKKKIRSNKRKIVQDKKALEELEKQKESLKKIVFELEEALTHGSSLLTEMKERINTFEHDAKCKQQAKCQAIIRLSYKQKKTKLLQKIKDGSYVRAVRNEERRQEEIMKIQNSLRAIQIIIEATINEHSSLTEAFGKVLDYIMVSKEL